MTDEALSLSRNDLNRMHLAARTLAKRILPKGSAVAQFSRLIRFTAPFVDESQAMVENEERQCAGDTSQAAQWALRLAVAALGREMVTLPAMPPQITDEMLPKKRESDEQDDNIKGLAELVADLGIAYQQPED